MERNAEAFQPKDFQPEPEKKSAVILPFRRKESPEEGNYEQYKALGGTLSQEEYQDVLKRAEEGRNIYSRWSKDANSMARAAEITLSPETVTLYGILRDEKPDPAKEHYSELNDQKLLAEALRIVGDESSLGMFIKKFTPTVFH
jgi:hypothetical protein